MIELFIVNMTKGFSVNIKGLKGLDKTLNKRVKDIKKVNQAKINAPVDFGVLRNSIHVENRKALIWKVADGTNYGIFQEKGTRKGIKAKKFLENALNKNRPFLIKKITKIYSS